MYRLRATLLAGLLGLALVISSTSIDATAVAARHAAHKKKRHAKKHRSAAKKRRTSAARGPKGDRGEKGDRGDRGEKGESGTSVVARARLAAPTATRGGGSEEVEVPLSGNTWTAAADEADDYAGSVTVTMPSACDSGSGFDPFSVLYGEEPGGFVDLGVFLDGEHLVGSGGRGWSDSDAGRSVTIPLRFGGRTLTGDAPASHTLTLRAYNGCGGEEQSFNVTDARVNVYGTH